MSRKSAKSSTPGSGKSSKSSPQELPQPSKSQIKNLALEYRRAADLCGNPNNWRHHPPEQLEALRGVIEDPEIGYAGALLFNERTNRLIDGHGRLKIAAPDELLPVLVGSWSEEAERKILLTLDPIGGMATANQEMVRVLLEQQPEIADLPYWHGIETALMEMTEATDEVIESSGGGSSTKKKKDGPAAYRILIECKSEREQKRFLDILEQNHIEGRAIVA